MGTFQLNLLTSPFMVMCDAWPNVFPYTDSESVPGMCPV